MREDGWEFWLQRGDGGAVHFTGGPARYQATEVYDPHGFKTDLFYDFYDGLAYLKKVQQPGNRWLDITWSRYPGFDVPFISKVETGGDAAGQRVSYKYNRYPYPDGTSYVLGHVAYENQPAPGQTAWASYFYGDCQGDVEPCPGEYHSPFPLLKVAMDPHYSGPMTKIKYTYGGGNCAFYPPPYNPPPPSYHDEIWFTGQVISEEKNPETDAMVSQFFGICGGLRFAYNGFGGRSSAHPAVRKLCFGSSAQDPEISAPGYMLTKVTDFGLYQASPISRRQWGSEPVKAWDGRNLLTRYRWEDDSGKPSRVEYPDLNHNYRLYNRITPSFDTEALDPDRMKNPNNVWLFSVTDERHNTTTYVRDKWRRITKVRYEGTGVEESYTYNDFNQVESHKLPSGALVTYEYDGYHRLWRESNTVDGWDARKEYRYYGVGNHPEWADLVEAVTDGRARANFKDFSTRMTYNGRQQVLTVEYAGMFGATNNPTVRYEYDPAGNCKAITDEMGHRREYTYDSYRRCTSLTEEMTSSGQNCTTSVFRRWDWIYDREIEATGERFGASTHTSKEWRVQIEPAFNDLGQRRMTARKFDVNNRITSEETGWIQPPGEISDNNPWFPGAVEKHSFLYDENGQKSHATDSFSRVTDYEYDERNRLWRTTEHPEPNSNTTARITDTFYDEVGNKTKVIFPDLNIQRWENNDAFGQPQYFYDESAHRTEFTYDWGPMKKLKTVTTKRTDDNGNTESQLTEFEYDGMGRPTKTIFPAPDHTEEVRTYEFGQLKTWKTRKNQLKTLVYDARGREKSDSWSLSPPPPPTASATPPTAPEITREWDDANRLKKIWNSFAIIDYTYDTAGQVQTEGTTVTGSGALREVSYCRYPNGEVRNTTYPDSTSLYHIYTARGQLDGVGWGVGATSYKYRPDGKVDYQTRTNNVRTAYGYNGRGMIISVRHRNTLADNGQGRDLAFREYWRDDRDRITAWKRGYDSWFNQMEDGRGTRYEYDPEGQLTRGYYRVDNPETIHPTGAFRLDIFDYDELGNRKGDQNYVASRGASMRFKRRNNGLNQYERWETVPVSWTTDVFYDDNFFYTNNHPYPQWEWPGNGVTMADGYTTACFNALNQPITIWSMAYAGTLNVMHFGFDPLGRCVKRWVGPSDDPNTSAATFFYYDGWNLIQEGTPAAPADRVYVHGGRVDEIVASRVSSTWYHHHYDAQGNCILQSNDSGGIQVQYDYDAFGFPYVYNAAGGRSLAQAQTRFLFQGREWLSDLRMYDYRNRLYQPELGRFLQPDPKHFTAGDYNLYRFCHNDPVNMNDPMGLDVSALPDWDSTNSFQASIMRPLWGLSNMESSRIHVFAHGTPGGAMNTAVSQEVKNDAKTINDVPAAMQWTPEQIAAAVEGDSSYTSDSTIELDICNGADAGPDGTSLQEKVAGLLPSTNTILASTGIVSAADGKSQDGTARKVLTGTKDVKKKDEK